jgi:ribosomal protein L28
MKKCDICGKGTQTMVKRTHSNKANKTTKKANIQTKKVGGRKIKICAKCLRTIKKNQ